MARPDEDYRRKVDAMDTAEEPRLGPIAGLHPSLGLGDGQWERVVKALRARGTKVDDALADRIDKEIQYSRRRRRDREWARNQVGP